MKKYLSLFLALCAVMFTSCGDKATDQSFFEWEAISPTEARLVSYNGNVSEVVIPETITLEGKTYSVTEIGKGAFEGSVVLTSVYISGSVKTIDNIAFKTANI